MFSKRNLMTMFLITSLSLLGAGEDTHETGVTKAAAPAPNEPAGGGVETDVYLKDDLEGDARLVMCAKILEREETLRAKEMELRKIKLSVEEMARDLADKLDKLSHFELVQKRREQLLAAKEQEIEEKKKALLAKEKELKKSCKGANVEKDEARPKRFSEEEEKKARAMQEKARIRSIARLLEKMDTTKAAKLAENLPSGRLAEVLAEMKTKKAAQVLAELSSKKAVAVLKRLGSTRNIGKGGRR